MAEDRLKLPTFEEHLSRFPYSAETGLDTVIADQHLVSLSTSIADWRLLTPFLCLTPAEENAIIISFPPSPPPRQCIDALRKWREKIGPAATYRFLIKALHEAKRADLIQSLSSIVASNPQPSGMFVRTDTDSLDFPDILQLYCLYLKNRYLANLKAVTVSIQWPPPSTSKIFNLAMIKSETIQRGKIDDEFIRLTITGGVDDILQRKVPIQLQNIFNGLDDIRKVVLIEGAPGSGKSTLCLDICLQWGRGKLFPEFTVVILVRLHDPLVQNACTIEDLLPCRDEDMRKNTANAIRANDGEGVLWILDGWDELSTELPCDSIIPDLVTPDPSLYKSSVIVTSRPIASGNLRRLASSRLEIIGFTPIQQREYFLECLNGDATLLHKLLEAIKDNVIGGSCYLPLNAAIIVHLFLANDGSLPTTVQGMFTAIVLCTLSRYLRKIGRVHEETQFEMLSDLPQELQQPFQGLCRIAFAGVMDNKITFTSGDLKSLETPETMCEAGLLQSVSSIVSQGTSVYFCFVHLSLQELLAALHISRMAASEQISIFQKLFGQSRFSAVFQFYAGITKLTISRPWLSLLPRFLRPVPADILDIVQKICRNAHDSKPLFVSLLHCLYEAQDLSLCRFVAGQLGGVLNLSYTRLSPLDTLSTGYFLSGVCVSSSGVFKVNLSFCSIDDQCCKFLMKGLHKCLTPNVSIAAQLEMDLGYNNISEDSVCHIADVLCNTSVLVELDLSYNVVKSSGLKCISDAMLANMSLTKLDLSRCSIEITEENGPVLTLMIQRNTTLQRLCFYDNPGVSDTGEFFIAEGLKETTKLRTLDLSSCNITAANGARFLSSALAINSSLEFLDLRDNPLSDYGVSHVANALSHNNGLKDINLRRCNISDKGAKTLCMALRDNKTLAKLDLFGNNAIKVGSSFVHLSQSRVTYLGIPEHLDCSTIQHTINEKRKRSGLAAIEVTNVYTAA